MSEYIRSNSNKNSCGSVSLIYANRDTCKNTNWMINSSIFWTLSPAFASSNYVFLVYNDSSIDRNYGVIYAGDAVRPTLYLSSDIKITGGTGTSSDPYQISL